MGRAGSAMAVSGLSQRAFAREHGFKFGLLNYWAIRLAEQPPTEQPAQQLNYPQSFVSKYERGESRLDFTEFMQISELLGIDLMTLIANHQKQSVLA